MEVTKQRDFATLTQDDIVTAIAEFMASRTKRGAHSVQFSHGVVAGQAAIAAKVMLLDEGEKPADNNGKPEVIPGATPTVLR